MESWQPQSLDELIEEVLTFMELSKWQLNRGRDKFVRLPLAVFREAEPFAAFDQLARLGVDDESLLIRSRVSPDEVPGPLDLTVMTVRGSSYEGPRDIPNEHFHLKRIQRVPLAKIRGQVRPVSSINVEVREAFVSRDGTYTSANYFLGYLPTQRRWVSTTLSAELTPGTFHEGIDEMAHVACGILLDRYARWRVVIAYEKGPSVSLITDAAGAQDFFRFRDVPEGRARHTALAHWVQEHWRKHRQDENLEILVRQHLRGETRFTWHGLRVEIKVSQADQDKAAHLADARQAEGPAMRAREPSP
jgi:hypothetical protein